MHFGFTIFYNSYSWFQGKNMTLEKQIISIYHVCNGYYILHTVNFWKAKMLFSRIINNATYPIVLLSSFSMKNLLKTSTGIIY